jgi:hypothetical protein
LGGVGGDEQGEHGRRPNQLQLDTHSDVSLLQLGSLCASTH